MKVPYSWLRRTATRDCRPRRSARRWRCTRSSSSGSPASVHRAPEGFVVGSVLSARETAGRRSPERLRGRDRRRKRGRSSAAPRTSPPARRSRWRFPGGDARRRRSSARRSCAAIKSNGMILSERRARAGGGSRRDHGPRGRPAAGTPLVPRCSPVSEPVMELEPTSNRVDCSASTGSRASSTPSPAPNWRPRHGRRRRGDGGGAADDYASVTVDVPDLCPRFSARVFTDVEIGPSPPMAEGTAARRGHAPDQQRRRHHELRDADDRPAAARVRPRQGAGRRDHRPRGERGRGDDDAGRRRAHLRRATPSSCATATVPRGSPGSWAAGLRGERRDHARPARGRDLERGQHPADVAQARPAHRRLEPIREAASSGAGAAGAAGRGAADGRALRRRLVPGDDRRHGGDPRAPPRAPARPARRATARDGRSRPSQRVEYLRRLEFDVDPGGEDLDALVPGPSSLRRHSRGGPDRGGRPDPRLCDAPAVDAPRRGAGRAR